MFATIVKYKLLLIFSALFGFTISFVTWQNRSFIKNAFFGQEVTLPLPPQVTIPTIIAGQLVLPTISSQPESTPASSKETLAAVSANLVGLFDQATPPKLTGIRIVGEVLNLGTKKVTAFSPVIKFLDKTGQTISQKIAQPSPNFAFFGLAPNQKTLFDVTVSQPPPADKIAIEINPQTGSGQDFTELKIATQSLEIKTAPYSPTSTPSSPQKVEYYLVSGTVENQLADSVTAMSIFAWAKDKNDQVFALSRQDFTHDLLPQGEKIDFKILLLPIKLDTSLHSFVVSAWGKRYNTN